MPKISYAKLIRDNIPDIIAAAGKKCVVDVLSDEEYLVAVDRKMGEELEEYLESGEIEELADLVEVIRAAVVARGYSWEQLENIRAKKSVKNGAFKKKLFLKSVTEDKEPQL